MSLAGPYLLAIDFLPEFRKVWGIKHLGNFLRMRLLILLTNDTVVQSNQPFSCAPNLSHDNGGRDFDIFAQSREIVTELEEELKLLRDLATEYCHRWYLLTLRALEAFTGHAITTEDFQANINHPSNALNMESNAHESFDELAWGIEALQQPGGQASHLVSSADPTL
ncbi:hypothetical protein JAAARDRAFT_201561 [Jaapia argillacea MUCL 33604]|uniref:Uncharacterized protein n=1 Tax=Jaapia argillacea MUCL 33604 TaxID=933084 RepID=A0A067QAT6_9AGAM|nr:hypothetical protein JAAARDRAFT_201561 [Jaapia argillacea MUCL 33604]